MHFDADTETRRTIGAQKSYRARRVLHSEWSPAQLIGSILGLVFVVLGGVAIARTGIDIHHVTAKHVQVAAAGHTQLLGYLELGFGVLMLVAAAAADEGRGLMSFLALVAIACGLIVAIQPSSFRRTLGLTGDRYGIFLVIVGAIALIAAVISPMYGGTSGWSGSSRQPLPRHPSSG